MGAASGGERTTADRQAHIAKANAAIRNTLIDTAIDLIVAPYLRLGRLT